MNCFAKTTRNLALFLIAAGPSAALAGVFTTPHYIEEKQWSLGVEPELTVSSNAPVSPGASGTGLGFDARFTYGVNDLSDAALILGSGTGPRQFRVGGLYTFDFVPDTGDQPGMGLALQGLSLARPGLLDDGTSGTVGTVEATAVPSIRKSFHSTNMQIEPYFALPMGWRFQEHDTSWITQAVFGALVQMTPSLKYSMELGINVASSESYISTGLTFFWKP